VPASFIIPPVKWESAGCSRALPNYVIAQGTDELSSTNLGMRMRMMSGDGLSPGVEFSKHDIVEEGRCETSDDVSDRVEVSCAACDVKWQGRDA
jgi:hypothetical protein